jgi:hypothetical protein
MGWGRFIRLLAALPPDALFPSIVRVDLESNDYNVILDRALGHEPTARQRISLAELQAMNP